MSADAILINDDDRFSNKNELTNPRLGIKRVHKVLIKRNKRKNSNICLCCAVQEASCYSNVRNNNNTQKLIKKKVALTKLIIINRKKRQNSYYRIQLRVI